MTSRTCSGGGDQRTKLGLVRLNRKTERNKPKPNASVFNSLANRSVVISWKPIFLETEQTEPLCQFKPNAPAEVEPNGPFLSPRPSPLPCSLLLAHSSSRRAGGPRTPAAPGVHGMVVLVATAARWPGGGTAARARPPAARARGPRRVAAEPEQKAAATVRFGTRHWKQNQ